MNPVYTVKEIANFCNVDTGFARRILDANEMRPRYVKRNLKAYTFYQIFLLKPFLEQLAQREIHFDTEKQEVFFQFESKLNYLDAEFLK